ncbi:hypothetical protein Tco_1532815 [Tanacetum coccineum]
MDITINLFHYTFLLMGLQVCSEMLSLMGKHLYLASDVDTCSLMAAAVEFEVLADPRQPSAAAELSSHLTPSQGEVVVVVSSAGAMSASGKIRLWAASNVLPGRGIVNNWWALMVAKKGCVNGGIGAVNLQLALSPTRDAQALGECTTASAKGSSMNTPRSRASDETDESVKTSLVLSWSDGRRFLRNPFAEILYSWYSSSRRMHLSENSFTPKPHRSDAIEPALIVTNLAVSLSTHINDLELVPSWPNRGNERLSSDYGLMHILSLFLSPSEEVPRFPVEKDCDRPYSSAPCGIHPSDILEKDTVLLVKG